MWGTSTCRIFAFRDSNKFNMQHDHALKKMNFDLLTPSPRVVERWVGGGGGGGGGGFCEQNICYHVAAFHESV